MSELISCNSTELDTAFCHVDDLLERADLHFADGKIRIEPQSYFQRDLEDLANGDELQRATAVEVMHAMADSPNEHVREAAALYLFVAAMAGDQEGALWIAEQLSLDESSIVKGITQVGMGNIRRKRLVAEEYKTRFDCVYTALHDRLKKADAE
jgi:hypothetical protein